MRDTRAAMRVHALCVPREESVPLNQVRRLGTVPTTRVAPIVHNSRLRRLSPKPTRRGPTWKRRACAPAGGNKKEDPWASAPEGHASTPELTSSDSAQWACWASSRFWASPCASRWARWSRPGCRTCPTTSRPTPTSWPSPRRSTTPTGTSSPSSTCRTAAASRWTTCPSTSSRAPSTSRTSASTSTTASTLRASCAQASPR